MPRTAPLILLVVLAACTSERQSNPVRDAFAQALPAHSTEGTAVVLRFPAAQQRRATATLYRLPALEEVAWRFEAGSGSHERAVGFSGDEDMVFTLTADSALLALDLASGRSRVVDTSVALATVGPTGATFTVHYDGSVATVRQRSATPWEDGFPQLPIAAWGAARDRLGGIVVDDSGTTLMLLADGQPPVTQRLPPGDVSVSRWGDVAAVAADSGIYLFDPTGATPSRFVGLSVIPRRLGFSPSGHRIYVVGAWGTLVSVDRFGAAAVDSLELAGAARSMRVDPAGRLLLVEPELGGEIWIVDLLEWELAATVTGEWDTELPTVAADGTVLLRHDDEVLTLSPETFEPKGSAEDAAGDHWLPFAWDPRRPALEFAREGAPEEEEASEIIYVQVSSTSNRDWAASLADNLLRAGMRASVLDPRTPDEPFRVVLGPFPTRDEAEATGRTTGLPFWIFTVDTTTVDTAAVDTTSIF